MATNRGWNMKCKKCSIKLAPTFVAYGCFYIYWLIKYCSLYRLYLIAAACLGPYLWPSSGNLIKYRAYTKEWCGSPPVKWPEHEGDCSPPTRAEVKKTWVYISTPPYVFMALCLVKHRDITVSYVSEDESATEDCLLAMQWMKLLNSCPFTLHVMRQPTFSWMTKHSLMYPNG
jgi:hypothetical protein